MPCLDAYFSFKVLLSEKGFLKRQKNWLINEISVILIIHLTAYMEKNEYIGVIHEKIFWVYQHLKVICNLAVVNRFNSMKGSLSRQLNTLGIFFYKSP